MSGVPPCQGFPHSGVPPCQEFLHVRGSSMLGVPPCQGFLHVRGPSMSGVPFNLSTFISTRIFHFIQSGVKNGYFY